MSKFLPWTDYIRRLPAMFFILLFSTPSINQWVNGALHFVLCNLKLNGLDLCCLSSSHNVHVLLNLLQGTEPPELKLFSGMRMAKVYGMQLKYSTLRLYQINTDNICKMQYPFFKSSSTLPNTKNVLNSPEGKENKTCNTQNNLKNKGYIRVKQNYMDCES